MELLTDEEICKAYCSNTWMTCRKGKWRCEDLTGRFNQIAQAQRKKCVEWLLGKLTPCIGWFIQNENGDLSSWIAHYEAHLSPEEYAALKELAEE